MEDFEAWAQGARAAGAASLSGGLFFDAVGVDGAGEDGGRGEAAEDERRLETAGEAQSDCDSFVPTQARLPPRRQAACNGACAQSLVAALDALSTAQAAAVSGDSGDVGGVGPASSGVDAGVSLIALVSDAISALSRVRAVIRGVERPGGAASWPATDLQRLRVAEQRLASAAPAAGGRGGDGLAR